VANEITNDGVARDLRDAITKADLDLLALINHRVRLVQRLRDHKVKNGYPMVDPAREEWLINELLAANPGPISDDGVRAHAEHVIALVKAEVYGEEISPGPKT
jgi:chorismate mutase